MLSPPCYNNLLHLLYLLWILAFVIHGQPDTIANMDKQSAVKKQSAPDAASVLAPALKVGALTGKSPSSISASIVVCRKSVLYPARHRNIVCSFVLETS